MLHIPLYGQWRRFHIPLLEIYTLRDLSPVDSLQTFHVPPMDPVENSTLPLWTVCNIQHSPLDIVEDSILPLSGLYKNSIVLQWRSCILLHLSPWNRVEDSITLPIDPLQSPIFPLRYCTKFHIPLWKVVQYSVLHPGYCAMFHTPPLWILYRNSISLHGILGKTPSSNMEYCMDPAPIHTEAP